MKTYVETIFIALPLSGIAMSTKPAVAQSMSKEICAQVISCGTKNGKVKEYPTPCAARDDGATDIHPKTGPICEVTK